MKSLKKERYAQKMAYDEQRQKMEDENLRFRREGFAHEEDIEIELRSDPEAESGLDEGLEDSPESIPISSSTKKKSSSKRGKRSKNIH